MTKRLSPALRRRLLRQRGMLSFESFSKLLTIHPLRPYQLEAGNAILDSVLNGRGYVITVMMPRQGGKNELAAQLEAYLLHLHHACGGSIVKTAPSFKPQLETSRDRLGERLMRRLMPRRATWRDGRTWRVGNASLTLLSADPSASAAGATASLLLAVDEAQDVDPDVYVTIFRPMLATRNGTTVLYGTAWGEDNILEEQRRINLLTEAAGGPRLHFETSVDEVVRYNPSYGKYFAKETERWGRDSLYIRTQFFLECQPGAGRLFPPVLIDSLPGDHPRRPPRRDGTRYVAGIDVAGTITHPGSESKPQLRDRAETVVVIGEVDTDVRDEHGNKPAIRVVDIIRLQGVGLPEQTRRLQHLLREQWDVSRVAVDATGVGAHLASSLAETLRGRVDQVVFTAESKSSLGYTLQSAMESRRLKMYIERDLDALELYHQLSKIRYRLRSNEQIAFSGPSTGRDDMVMALALLVRAAGSSPPSYFGFVIRAPDPDPAAGWEEHMWGRPHGGLL